MSHSRIPPEHLSPAPPKNFIGDGSDLPHPITQRCHVCGQCAYVNGASASAPRHDHLCNLRCCSTSEESRRRQHVREYRTRWRPGPDTECTTSPLDLQHLRS
ncbi:hypothetical protein Cob_v001925 [Colletotrichum orbiculare MAFF 240422]|uniref:Uncharacterized protein n=1 Tax=Colletotrichum orbiculare (strain 104-T / ATCC 96160 / CBS 514.97 / LARS 414 / MAFF 240422) TaxID=1213857 RepID=A0A484G7D7_COLOR|nr:hypothetical protein Cob_v001925 [Colletotrichum orbiculare MAFF 240422]